MNPGGATWRQVAWDDPIQPGDDPIRGGTIRNSDPAGGIQCPGPRRAAAFSMNPAAFEDVLNGLVLDQLRSLCREYRLRQGGAKAVVVERLVDFTRADPCCARSLVRQARDMQPNKRQRTKSPDRVARTLLGAFDACDVPPAPHPSPAGSPGQAGGPAPASATR